MSVNNPSDSGGGGGAEVAFANPPSMSEMDMGAMGAWAEIMAEEQVQSAPPSEKNDEHDSTQEQSAEENNGSTMRKQSEQQQYFAVQVTNLPACTNEELFYHFGGDSVVRDIAFLPDRRCAARIDLHTIEGLKRAKELDGQQFRGRTLRVYEIREDRVQRQIPHEFTNRQFSNEPPPYSRESSRYNSQSSLYSNDARTHDRGNRSYNNSNDYRGANQYRGPMAGGTFPRGGGKYFNNYDEYNNMGRYPGGQSFRGGGPYYNHQYGGGGGGGYPPRSRGMQGRGGYNAGGGGGGYFGGQDLQRSDSYHHDERDRPAPITRSRTESTAFDAERRKMELSRTSSRLSTSTEDVDNPTPRVPAKKLTNKDIFGEAKPVDTSERLREIEAKQERERMLEQQKYKEEAEAARLAAAAEHTDNVPPHRDQHQYPIHQGHPPHHGNHHHQFHHAPSRQGLPPVPYGPYQTHNMQQHAQQPHPNAGQYHPQQRYDGGGPPGSYRIMRRESADATDASPPLDPVHAKAPAQNISISEKPAEATTAEMASPGAASSGDAPPTSARRDSVSDRRRPNDSMSSSGGAETLPRPQGKQRIVYRSKGAGAPLQKSATISEIRDAVAPQRGRGGGRGGRGGRGYHRGAAPNDRRSSFSGVEKPAPISANMASMTKSMGPENETNEQRQSNDERQDRPERKEHHGSHASLRGSRTGTLRRNRGSYHKDRTPRASRDEEPSDAEPRKDPQKPTEDRQERIERPERPERIEEKPASQPAKKEPAKAATPAAVPATSTSSTSTQDKKKEKKKSNKKETSKGGKALNNNKFALLVDSEDL